MAQGRFLSKTISSEPKFRGLSSKEILFYIFMIPHADAYGRLVGTSRYLISIVDSVEDIDYQEIDAMLNNLNNKNLIDVYTVDGTRYIELVGFINHQKINITRETNCFIPDKNGVVPPPFRKKKDIHTEARESKNKSKTKQSYDPEIRDAFEELWKLYPKKVGKEKAFIHFRKQYKEAKDKDQFIEDISNAIKNYKYTIEQENRDVRYIKHGDGFFNKLWFDYKVAPDKAENIDVDDKASELRALKSNLSYLINKREQMKSKGFDISEISKEIEDTEVKIKELNKED